MSIVPHRHFGDRMNISPPFLRPIFEPLAFGFFIPNITAEITCACANLKPRTRAKPFPRFEIFRMHDQNFFSWIGVISSLWAVAF